MKPTDMSIAYSNDTFIGDDGEGNGIESYEKHKPVELTAKSANGLQVTDDYEPYAHRIVRHPLTNMETMVHLLKCALGTGIFAMPNAFNHAGYIIGFFGTIILGSIATYCVHILVNLHYDLCKWKRVPSMSYPLLAEAALLSGPKCFHRYAKHMVHIINAFLLLYQIGSCCIYVVFMATNLQALFSAFGIEIDVRIMMVIILLPLILINWVRKLKYLAPLSTVGNFITIGSFVVIFYYILREPITLEGKRPIATISEFPLFFNTVLFALEAIGVIMPLENEMKTPKDYRGPTGILNRAMFFVVSTYIALGLAGYIRYGADVQPTITVNLPEHELLAIASKGLIALGVFAAYAIACYVAIDIALMQYVNKRIEKSSWRMFWEYALRTGIVFITFSMAIVIPDLDLFISLIGALTLSSTGILFPPFLETVSKWNRCSGFAKAFMIFKNCIICIIGMAGFIIGTSLSMRDIINTYLD